MPLYISKIPHSWAVHQVPKRTAALITMSISFLVTRIISNGIETKLRYFNSRDLGLAIHLIVEEFLPCFELCALSPSLLYYTCTYI